MKIVRIIALGALVQLLLLSVNPLFGQKLKPDDVPGDVSRSLEIEHPGAKVSSWVLENSTFVANFKEDGATAKAYFSNDGKWLRTTYDIPKNEIPPAIPQYVKDNYTNSSISAVYLQQKPKMKMHYYVEVKPDGMGAKPSILTFTDAGVLMERSDPEGFEAKKPEPKKEVAEPAQAKEEKKSKKKGETVEETVTTEVNPNSIPVPVTKAFVKKVQRPEELKWYREDSLYVAKCIFRLQPTEVFITPAGVWQKTVSQLEKESITGNMLKYLTTNYKGYRFSKAYKELRADKQDITTVEIYEKENWKAKLVTTVIFDKTGKLVRTIDPDYALDGNYNQNSKDDGLDSYYAKVDMNEDDAIGKELKSKDLPPVLQSYVSVNYPSYTYKSCTITDDEDLGEIYRIQIRAEGIGSDSEVLYFNKEGKFLKKESASGDEGEIAPADQKTKAPALQVPEEVTASFKSKYPRVVSPEWSQDDDDNFVVKFNDTKGKQMCIFNKTGALLETHLALNPANATVSIEDYVKKTFKGSKITEYYSVKKADRKSYYKVVVQNKKTGDSDIVWFTSAGKIITDNE